MNECDFCVFIKGDFILALFLRLSFMFIVHYLSEINYLESLVLNGEFKSLKYIHLEILDLWLLFWVIVHETGCLLETDRETIEAYQNYFYTNSGTDADQLQSVHHLGKSKDVLDNKMNWSQFFLLLLSSASASPLVSSWFSLPFSWFYSSNSIQDGKDRKLSEKIVPGR